MRAGPAVPTAPEIIRSLAKADGATISFAPVASATSYRIELSHDGGTTWTTAGTATTPEFTLTGIKAPDKVQLRVVALNGTTEGPPSTDYPVYVAGRPAGPPEGLRLTLAMDRATASWGEVLGAKEYVIYRRQVGQNAWTEVHRGPQRSFVDHLQGISPAEQVPGLEAEALRQPAASPIIYEYAVSSVDGLGESVKSSIATTDPASWRNWYPEVPLIFKRRSAYWLPPNVMPDQVPPAYYP